MFVQQPAPVISPLFELAMSVTAVGTIGPWNGSRWEREAVLWYRQPSLLRALCPRGGHAPAFFLAPETGPVTLEEDIARLAFLDAEELQEAACTAARLCDSPPMLDEVLHRPRVALAQLIREVDAYGSSVFTRHWPLIRAHLVSAPSPVVDGHATRVVPSAFVQMPRVVEGAHARHVVYPIPDPGAAFGVPARVVRWRQPLADLLGARRAVALMLLTEPATISQLCEWTQLSTHAVTHHLKVLRRAGLVRLKGRGATARWERTAVGTALVESAAIDGRQRHRRYPVSAVPIAQ